MNTDVCRRNCSLVIITLLLAMVVLSAFFLGHEAGHHCEDDHCEVCACLEICEAVLQKLQGAGPLVLTLLFVIVSVAAAGLAVTDPMLRLTPVDEKVRLND